MRAGDQLAAMCRPGGSRRLPASRFAGPGGAGRGGGPLVVPPARSSRRLRTASPPARTRVGASALPPRQSKEQPRRIRPAWGIRVGAGLQRACRDAPVVKALVPLVVIIQGATVVHRRVLASHVAHASCPVVPHVKVVLGGHPCALCAPEPAARLLGPNSRANQPPLLHAAPGKRSRGFSERQEHLVDLVRRCRARGPPAPGHVPADRPLASPRKSDAIFVALVPAERVGPNLGAALNRAPTTRATSKQSSK